MKQHIAGTLIVLVITISHSFTFDNDYGDDYSEEDLDYETYFDKYDPGKHMSWGQDSREKPGYRGPLNLRGNVRRRFGLETALRYSPRSLVCSPVSIVLSLGKLALGAEGSCLTQLLNAIGLNNKKQIKRAFKPIIKGLEFIKGVRLHVISKIYVSKEVRLRSTFRRRARKIFKSSVVALDFNKPAGSASFINDWVKKQTRHGIEKVISENDISRRTSLLLVNAVYFAGFWENKFEKVSESKFYGPSFTRKISMMTRRGTYKYGRSDPLDSQLVEIPFEGGKTSFFIVLPNSKDDLPILLEKISLAPKLLLEALKRMYDTDIIMSIPKFRTEIQMDLNLSFEKLGLRDIFRKSNSGLEKIAKRETNMHLSKAVHRTVLVINEFGAKAATSSVLDIVDTMAPNLNKIIFNANHPFMYFITYESEQLFFGILGE